MRGRAWLQPPPPSRVYLDGHLPCHTPLVAMGARVWELLEVIDKGLCLSKLVSPPGGGSGRPKFLYPMSLSVLGGEALGRSGKDSLSLSASPQPALGECGRTLRDGDRGGPTQPSGSYPGRGPGSWLFWNREGELTGPPMLDSPCPPQP